MSIGDHRQFQVIEPVQAQRMKVITSINYLKGGCLNKWQVTERWKEPRGMDIWSRSQGQSTPHAELKIQFSFLKYAAEFWPSHASQVDRLDSDLLQVMDDFMHPDSHDFESWKDFWGGIMSFVDSPSSVTPLILTPLHIAAHCGLTSCTEQLLLRGQGPMTKDSFERTPLAYAAMECRATTAKHILPVPSSDRYS